MRTIIKRLIDTCNRLDGDCDYCVFKNECDSVSTNQAPPLWSENDYNTFCELIIREDDEP